MNDWTDRVEALDLSLFNAISSQTSEGDRRSLLAVQRAIARGHNEYVYLEIGSHLGGTIQPYLADERCRKIYSIDPRPSQQPDDRSPGYIATYENNSSERMLEILENTGLGDVQKIESIELDASEVELNQILQSPQITFIDGEHTRKAVISDFSFCRQVISRDGVILFHDFYTICPAILEICDQLSKENKKYTSVKLEDNVFAIFLDENILAADSHLTSLYNRDRHFMTRLRMKMWFNLPLLRPLFRLLKGIRRVVKRYVV
jgi:hypothetical protein